MENSKIFEEKPISLISLEDSKLSINPEALKIISQIPKPISIITIAGLYRTGKSYLLNRVILNKNSGFNIGSTINPCTKGIWMWGKPLKGTAPDGRIVNIILLDSEGLAAVDVDVNHDSRIFSLVLLLSSYFVYNSLGAIDESALENLSLIVNLTKNIQIRQKGNEGVSFDDFSCYMPDFLWVLRDFSLELVDAEGESLTSNDYLESALLEQKGFSEAVEQKNKIRSVLKGFFKDRECFTMIRPLVDENLLRNLHKIEVEKLRPEFVDQVINLRKKILSHTKIKELNNSELDGSMYVNLIKNYVEAINTKALPNIQNAWTYLCKTKCNEAYDNNFEKYETDMKEALVHSWPVSKNILKAVHYECLAECLKNFEETAIGDNIGKYTKMLKENIGEKYKWLKGENLKEFEKLFLNSMNTFYNENIEKGLKENYYKNYIDFEKDIREFESYFLELEPQGPKKHVLLLEFLMKKINEGIYLFINSIESNYEGQLKLFKNHKKDLEKELKQIKNDTKKENTELHNKIKDIELVNKDISSKIELIEKSYSELKVEKEKTEKECQKKLEENKGNYKEELTEVTKEKQELLKKLKDLDRNNIMINSEFDKEKALLMQKVEFYEKRMNNLNKSEKDFQENMITLKNEYEELLKNTNNQFEEKISDQKKEINILEERLNDVEEELEKKEREVSDKDKKFKSKEKKLNDELNCKKKQIIDIEKKLKSDSGSLASKEKLKNLNKEIENLNDLLSEEEGEKKDLETKMKTMKKNHQKEKAILEQNSQFMDMNCKDMQRQLEKTKKLYNEALKALENTACEEKMDLNHQLTELTNSHKKEISNYEKQLQNSRQNYNEELKRITELKESLEKELIESEEKYKKEITKLRDIFENVDKERLDLKKELQFMEEQKEDLIIQNDERFRKQIEILENEIDEMKTRNSEEYSINQQKQEENFKQMKNFFDNEKERLEQKITSDKQKYDIKMKNLQEEYDNQIYNDKLKYEEDLENMQNETQEIIINNMARIQQMEQEISIRQQKNENLLNELQKTSNEYEMLKKNYDANIEEIKNNLESEKKELKENYDKIKFEYSEKENQFWNLKQSLEKAKNEIIKGKDKYNLRMKPLEEENKTLKIKFENLKEKLDIKSDENVEQKIDYGKKLALSQQQNEFYSKRLEEVTKQLEGNMKRFDLRQRELKDEFSKEINLLKEKYSKENKELEEKYQYKRKNLKEAEANFNEKINFLEKSKGELLEKLNYLQKNSSENKTKLIEENEEMKDYIKNLEEKLLKEKTNLKEQIKIIKNEKYTLEMEYAEIEASYEKDKALWDDKFEFQNNQKDELMKENEHIQNNFDLMLRKIQKMRSNEKEDINNTQNVLITNLEQKYKAQINEINEKHKNVLQAYNDRNLKLEKQIKSLNSKLENSSNVKLEQYKELENKLENQKNREKQFLDQISKIKRSRDSIVQKVQEKCDRDIEQLKIKLKKIEQMAKEKEESRSRLLFEHEKDKTKWTIEKQHIISQKNDFMEQVSYLERKKDNLLRENEGLKNENRKNKKLLGNNFSSNLQGKFGGFNNLSKLHERSFITFESKISSLNFKLKDKDKISFLPDNNSDNEENNEDILKTIDKISKDD